MNEKKQQPDEKTDEKKELDKLMIINNKEMDLINTTLTHYLLAMNHGRLFGLGQYRSSVL